MTNVIQKNWMNKLCNSFAPNSTVPPTVDPLTGSKGAGCTNRDKRAASDGDKMEEQRHAGGTLQNRAIYSSPSYKRRGSKLNWRLLCMITTIVAVFNQAGKWQSAHREACNCTKAQFLGVANLEKFSSCPLEPLKPNLTMVEYPL